MNEGEAIKRAKEIEALKKEGKIRNDDKEYWTIEINDEPKGNIPEIYDCNGVLAKEGDVIEFSALLDANKKATAIIKWSNPCIACSSGKRIEGKWIGNGILNEQLYFTILN